MHIFNRKRFMIIFVILMFMMIIGSFYDYQIATTLSNPNSKFGIFLASYGQVPAMLLSSISGTLLFKIIDRQHKIKMALCVFFGILLNILAIMGISMDPMLYIKSMPLVLSVVIAILIVGMVDILILKLTKDSDKKDLKKFIILLLVVMFGQIILINMVKIPWSRPRMRMISEQSETLFQPWWQIGCNYKEQLINSGVAAEEFKSFPSGHAGNSTCAIMLAILPLICKQLQGKEKYLFISGIVFCALVSFSRLVMGAHFLSDITVGIFVTIMFIFIFTNLLWPNKTKE